MIAGLENVSDGNILFDGVVVNNLSPKERDVAMVFVSYALYPHMTVYNNIAFPLRMRKYKRHQMDEEVRRVASLLGLTELLARKPKRAFRRTKTKSCPRKGPRKETKGVSLGRTPLQS